MKNYPPSRKRSTIMGLLAILFALLSLVNLIFITPFLSYLTPILFLVDITFAIFWICKRDVVMIIPIVASLTQLFPLPSFVKLWADNSNGDATKSIKVATYNIRTFKHNQITTTENIVSIMQKEGADIVCFQEFVETSDSVDFYQMFSYFPYYCVQEQETPHSTRLAIFSRYPIIETNTMIFKNKINSAMAIDIDINGTAIRVINCHFQTTGFSQKKSSGSYAIIESASNNSIIRKVQVDAVAELIDRTTSPIILCGDFNDPPISYSYRTIHRKLRDGFIQSGKGIASTFIGGFRSLLRIDYIFNSKDFKCSEYDSPNYVFSDHKPVISTLEYKTRK